MEIENLIKLIHEVSKSGLSKFEYEENGIRIILKAEKEVQTIVTQTVSPAMEPVTMDMQGMRAVPSNVMAGSAVAEPNHAGENQAENVAGTIAKAPLVGTFYAAPSDGAKPFAQVGDVVKKGQTLGIIEAMKLMNEIECETDGTIEEVYVENQQMVEYGQPLFRIV